IILFKASDNERIGALKFNVNPAHFCEKHVATRLILNVDRPSIGTPVPLDLTNQSINRNVPSKPKITLSQNERMNRASKRRIESNIVMEIEVPEMVVVNGCNKRKTKYQRSDINEPSVSNNMIPDKCSNTRHGTVMGTNVIFHSIYILR
ncbi:hypothetical protein PMAYCL1PPCAC_01165, partial [Pristionchus mayeri]